MAWIFLTYLTGFLEICAAKQGIFRWIALTTSDVADRNLKKSIIYFSEKNILLTFVPIILMSDARGNKPKILKIE